MVVSETVPGLQITRKNEVIHTLEWKSKMEKLAKMLFVV